jgi:SWI/SNF-related matrix-associated actin-dependent regulator 1 of chromatin subfamily A
VIDESHSIKNGKSKRAKACAALAEKTQHHILLSGTAIKNSRDELFPQLQIVNPTLYPSERSILAETIGAFWHKISSCYLPMAKADILRFLPPKIVTRVAEGVVSPVAVPRSIEEVARAKVECAFSKIEITKDYLENFIENSDGKALVFSDSLEVCETLFAHFGSDVAILHHGQMSDNKREEAKEQFQREGDTHRLFITTRQSLAVGATLTAADTVVFNDLPWTTADIQQAEDRAHRIGQLKSVNVIWMIAENSEFDAHLCDMLYRKYLICKAVNEGKQITEEERKFMETAVTFADLIRAAQEKKKK